jgi:hypothetical protein
MTVLHDGEFGSIQAWSHEKIAKVLWVPAWEKRVRDSASKSNG